MNTEKYDMHVCKYCGKQYDLNQARNGHQVNCSLNPQKKEIREKIKYSLLGKQKNKIRAKDKYIIQCQKCGKQFQLQMTEYIYNIESYRHYCSRSCANSRNWSEQDKLKKSIAVKNSELAKIANRKKSLQEVSKICPICQKQFYTKRVNQVYCSRTCASAGFKGFKNNGSRNRRRTIDIREGYIYLIKNNINDKIYIGKRCGRPVDSPNYFGSGKAIKRAIKKYNKSSFSKIILQQIKNGDLNERERYWIEKYHSNTAAIGYNLTEGGDGGALFIGKKHTEQTKQKIRKSVTLHEL